MKTRVRPLVNNKIVPKIEQALAFILCKMTIKLKEIRDKQLKNEIIYLEKELQNARKRVQEKK